MRAVRLIGWALLVLVFLALGALCGLGAGGYFDHEFGAW